MKREGFFSSGCHGASWPCFGARAGRRGGGPAMDVARGSAGMRACASVYMGVRVHVLGAVLGYLQKR